MAKYYGSVGYAKTQETNPGVWTEEITERDYYGDVLQFGSRWESGGKVNDDINVTNKISIVADPFAYENFSAIRYVSWMGTKWKVSSIEIQFPRLVLTIGGVYNGEQDQTT